MIQIRLAQAADVPAITEIYNQAILRTTATFDTEIKTAEDRSKWLAAHSEKYPVIVALKNDTVVGWASLTQYSDKCAYENTAEISVYVDENHRKQGIGKKLMQNVLALGKTTGIRAVIARIAAGNEQSIHLHQVLGFFNVGTLKEVGKKFGKVLDVHILQALL